MSESTPNNVIDFPPPPPADPWDTVQDVDLLNYQTRAELMSRIWKGKAYYRPTSKSWIIWNDDKGYWQDEREPKHMGLWEVICQEFLAKCCDRADELNLGIRFGPDSLLSHKAWTSVARLTRHQRAFRLDDRQFDINMRYMGVNNGVLDLNTGRLLKASPHLLVSTRLAVNYNPEAHSSIWDQFLVDISGDTLEGRDYRLFLREHFGAMLGGENEWEKFTIMHGPGGTGKSTFGNTIQRVLGVYGLDTNHDTFSRQRSGAIREDLAAFEGKRMVFAMELPDGHRLDPSIIKMLSGRDTIRARRLYEGAREIEPTWSIAVACNLLPRLDPPPDSGFWRRVLVLPFYRKPKRQDQKLKNKLRSRQAKEAVFAWLVAGHQANRNRPYQTPTRLPKAVQKACAGYRIQYDHLGYWLEMNTTLQTGASTSNVALYASYLTFCGNYNVEPENVANSATFGKYLSKQGFTPIRTMHTRSRANIEIRKTALDVSEETSDADGYSYPVNLGDFHI